MRPELALAGGWLALLLTACAPGGVRPDDPWAGQRQADGSVVWLDEYRFEPPPPPWETAVVGEEDVSFAFLDLCTAGGSLCQNTMAYAEEPFGYSHDLQTRAGEFFRRFLWASRVVFAPPELTPAVVDGREALAALVEGREPVSGEKVQAKVLFVRRGERVVALFATQWRSGDAAFDPAVFALFDRFVASFRFVKPSFFETL